MIDDGYTEEFQGFRFRPLLGVDRLKLEALHRLEDWWGIDDILWSPIRFDGGEPDETQLTEITKRQLEWDDENDFNNLRSGLEIALKHPLLSLRSCELCKAWWFNQDTGYVCLNERGPIRRKRHAKASCETTAGCEKGHHSSPAEWSPRNQQAWKHYLEWRHVGLPDLHKQCPIVRRNWKLIGDMIEQYGLPKIHLGIPGTPGK